METPVQLLKDLKDMVHKQVPKEGNSLRGD